MKKRSMVHLIKIAAFATVLGMSGPVYCKASVSVPLISVQSANPIVSKPEQGDKNNDTVPAKTAEELQKELSNIKGRNDEMNEKVSKSNTQIIDTLKKIKGKKGISKKKLRVFNRNEEAIAGKLESLTKLIEGLKENADKISLAEKRLNELTKNEESSKQVETKQGDGKNTESKTENKVADTKGNENNKINDAKAAESKGNETKVVDNKGNEVKVTENKTANENADNSDNVRIQLESLIWLQLDRNRLFLQIFDTLTEISYLLP